MACYERPSAGSGGTVEILVSERSNLESIKDAVELLVLRFGTIECGIGGFDFSIRTEREARDPGISEEIVPGIRAITRSR